MKKLVVIFMVLVIFTQTFAGRKAPYFNLPSDQINEQQKINLKQLKGKPIVLIFWGVNCVTCKSELPILNSIYNIYKDKGIQFYTVVVDSKNKIDILKTKQNWGISIPGLISDKATMYKYRIVGVPIIYFINKDLKVVKVLYGAQPQEKIKKILNNLLKNE